MSVHLTKSFAREAKLAQHTVSTGARNEIFPLRPAPVQCAYMGFPATMGADYLPYLISDPVVAPPRLHGCYSEKLALMPHCYFINDYKQAHADLLDEANLPKRAEVWRCPACTDVHHIMRSV